MSGRKEMPEQPTTAMREAAQEAGGTLGLGFLLRAWPALRAAAPVLRQEPTAAPTLAREASHARR